MYSEGPVAGEVFVGIGRGVFRFRCASRTTM